MVVEAPGSPANAWVTSRRLITTAPTDDTCSRLVPAASTHIHIQVPD